MLGAELRQATFKPGTHEVAVVVRAAGRSEVRIVDVDHPGHARLLFAGPGHVRRRRVVAGRRLAARQLAGREPVGVHQGKQVRAVANIREQFARADGLGPLLELSGRWCCSK